MKKQIMDVLATVEEDLVKFSQDLVRIKSFTGQEEEIIKFIKNKMFKLGYDDVIIDGMGNCIGVIGNGNKKIMFDSHIDTVAVNDEDEWSVNPFGGDIIDGKLYGRGSVDMKCAAAATIYAGYAIKELRLDKGKTVYVSISVMEEDYDGENLRYQFTEGGIKPDYVVICEPSQCSVSLGQKGRALFKINMEGVSAHGSAPEKGVNPVYKMSEIIERIEKLNEKLCNNEGNHGTVALTKIESESASYNAIPFRSSIYMDRRLVEGEDEEAIKKEMEELLSGTDGTWEVFKVIGKSWTGTDVIFNSFLPAWEIDMEHELTKAAFKAYEAVNENSPEITRWDFSTNGVTSAKFGIPTIGFGPGNSKLAHMKDEYCTVTDIIGAFKFYTSLVGCI